MESRARARIARFPATPDINPYQCLLYRHLGELGFDLDTTAAFTLSWLWRGRSRPAYLHFHWRIDRLYRRPTVPSWLGSALFALRLRAARLLGYRLVWTVHQPYPHDAPESRLDRVAARFLARSCHLLFAHDDGQASTARAVLGCSAARIAVVPHGSYVGFYPAGRPPAVVRSELGIPADAFVFLCFGSLRRYKRIDLLLDAFASLSETSIRLLVAGEDRDVNVAASVRAAAARDGRIIPLLEVVPDGGVAELFAASDAKVVARGDGWTSGSLILALSHGLPVVAASTPAYRKLLDEGDAGWLFAPGDVQSLRHALCAAAADRALAARKGEAAHAIAGTLSWSRIAEQTAEALQRS